MALLDFLKRRDKSVNAEMSFIDHLEELRWHLIRSVLAIMIGAILIFATVGYVVNDILLAPSRADFPTAVWLCEVGHKLGIGDALCIEIGHVEFISTQMTGQFISTFTIAFIGGFIIAFPYVFWQFWRFIKPALSEKELKGSRTIIFSVSLLFFIGVAFGYFILTPFMVNFYLNYQLSPQVKIMPDFSDYLENFIYTTVGIGLLFQLPLLVLTLTKVGILTPKFLKTYRRHAFVAILILAAIITPTTDPFSLTIVTIPLYLLYEASIAASSRMFKGMEEKKKDEWS